MGKILFSNILSENHVLARIGIFVTKFVQELLLLDYTTVGIRCRQYVQDIN